MIGRLFSTLWRIINVSRKILLNIIFFTLFGLFIVALSSEEKIITVPENSALILNLSGQIVEQLQEVNPADAFINEAMDKQDESPEVLLSDIIYTIEKAKDDDRIKLMVLKLGNMQNSGLSKLQDIAKAIDNFKTSGKQVIAIGDQYSQEQYYLASHANNIWLDPKGWLLLEGYSRYSMYFKTALEKLSIKQHVFRVGTFKSAVEPFIRDDMSDAAKEANLLWLNDLWTQYKTDVAKQRGFALDNFDENADNLITKIEQANGNLAEYALQNNWVDELKTREEMITSLMELSSSNHNKNNFKQINFKTYLNAINSTPDFTPSNNDKVAIIVASGNILDGTQKPGTIGGDSTAKLLRQARFDDNVKAVVLRVDSPGGSAYASEIIRQEIVQLKAAGKPVVASMGTYAASGGYWISASADKIIAAPSTITGSIGIFGLMMTFEDSLSNLGIFTDGVSTTEIGGFGVTRPLNDGIARLIQLSINRGYQDFISLVAQSRNMSVEEVDKIAQGRVWSGVKAKELGLVDELGDINDAITTAANLAGLENYDRKLFEKEPTALDKFIKQAFGKSAEVLFTPSPLVTAGPVDVLMKQLRNEVNMLNQFNDPSGVYSFCLTCKH